MPSKSKVVITGLGIRSPLGNTVDSFFDSILDGETDFSNIDFLNLGIDIKASFFKNRSSNNSQDGYYTATDFSHKLLLNTALDALNDAGINDFCRSCNTIALLGTTSGGSRNRDTLNEIFIEKKPHFPHRVNSLQGWHSPAEYLRTKIHLHSGTRTLMTACSSGVHTIGYGKMLIQNGVVDRVIAGGYNTLSVIPVLGFHSIGTMAKDKISPFDTNRDGFYIGEGAAVLILESLETAIKRNAPMIAEVRGFNASSDIDPKGNLTIPIQKGYCECMRNAVLDAHLPLSDSIDYINAHGTATKANDKTETLAIKECFPDFDKIPVSSTKSSTGHTLGAAGAIETLICVKAIKDQVIPPNKNLFNPDPACEGMCFPIKKSKRQIHNVLCNSFGFGGNNTSLVLGRIEE